jgi:hypothetical protein
MRQTRSGSLPVWRFRVRRRRVDPVAELRPVDYEPRERGGFVPLESLNESCDECRSTRFAPFENPVGPVGVVAWRRRTSSSTSRLLSVTYPAVRDDRVPARANDRVIAGPSDEPRLTPDTRTGAGRQGLGDPDRDWRSHALTEAIRLTVPALRLRALCGIQCADTARLRGVGARTVSNSRGQAAAWTAAEGSRPHASE